MADYIITRADGEDLQHFGTKGMRWGERRFQNEDGSLTALGRERYGVGGERSARRTSWDLNKLDREQTEAKARMDYYKSNATTRITRATKKLHKAEKKGADEEKITKLKSKLEKAENHKDIQKAKEYEALLERSKAMTDKIIKASVEKGYSIKSKDVLRSVNHGRSASASILGTMGGMALGAATGVGVGVMYTEYAQGKSYKVKNDGLGTQTHQSKRFIAYPTVYYVPKRAGG